MPAMQFLNRWKYIPKRRKWKVLLAFFGASLALLALYFQSFWLDSRQEKRPGEVQAAPSRTAAALAIPFELVTVDGSMAGDVKMVGDIDGDSNPDLVIGGKASQNEDLSWYLYPGWTKTVIDSASNEFTTDGELGDVDGDNDLDIVVPDGSGADNLVWYENPRPGGDPAVGSQWTRHEVGTIGSWGKDVELADFDQNGQLDIATRSNSTAMIFFQTGPNVWVTANLTVSGLGNEGMASGDIDDDLDTDLVFQGVWLRNPGGNDAQTPGNWSEHAIGSAPSAFKSLVVDLDGNNKADVLFSSSESTADVEWWTPVTADPTGPWTSELIAASVEKAHTLQAADMDKDGDLDVVVGQMHTASGPQEIFVMVNSDGQATTWSKEVVGTGGIHNGVVADIGSDGDFDIYGANWTGNPPLRLWENKLDSSLTFSYKEVTDSHTQTFGLAFGDVDGDGSDDIISGTFWYRNPDGDLQNTWTQTPLPANLHGILVVDVDGDPWIDIIAQEAGPGDIEVHWLEAANSSGTAWNTTLIGTVDQASHSLGAQGYRTGQIEAGGKPEVLLSSGNGIYYFRIPANPEAGNWPRIHVNGNPSDEGFDLGDIDSDGHLDVAATTGNNKTVEWYENPGNGTGSWQAYEIGLFSEALFPDRVAVRDLDGDLKLDIVVTEENGGSSNAETYWWSQPADPTSSNWTKSLVVSQATTNSMDVADIDEDNDIDLVLAEHRGNETLSLWLNDGAGIFTEKVISTGKESHLGARLHDLDGDGDLDIVSIAWDAWQFLHLWEQGSSGGFEGIHDAYLPVVTREGGGHP